MGLPRVRHHAQQIQAPIQPMFLKSDTGEDAQCRFNQGQKSIAARQVFFLSSLRFSTISLRESKLEIARVWDLAPSFSACNS